MKIIGEKLSKQEMLNAKGGECFLCTCADWSGQWYGEYNDLGDTWQDLLDYCDGNGSCDPSSLCGRT